MSSMRTGRASNARANGHRFALLLLSVFVVGCNSGGGARTAAADPAYGGTFVIAGPADFDQANPLVTADAWTQELNRFLLFMPLVRYGPHLDVEPYLARAWSFEGDTAVTFTLRDDVFWHDGHRTSAHDVRFTYERAFDPATAYPNAGYFSDWMGVQVIDSFTVRFRFRPHADPLAGVALLPVLPAHLLGDVPPDQLKTAAFNRAPVGNGPFRFASQQPDDRWVFEANREFPAGLGGRPRVDRLVWRVVPDRTAQVTELLTGNADLIVIPPSERFAELSREPNVRAVVRPSFKYAFIGWNGRRAPFGDARVRRALTMAIDRAAILNALRSGYGELAAAPVHPHHWAYDRSLEPLPFDTAAARALLASAAITDRDGNGTLDLPNGKPFAFSLSVQAGSDFNQKTAELLQANFARLGITMRLRATEWNTLVSEISSESRDFDAVLMGWEADFRTDLRDLFHSASMKGPFQLASYANPVADSLIDRAAKIVDRQASLPVWHQLQRVLRDDQPWSFLYYFPDLILASSATQNVTMDLRGVLATSSSWGVTRDRVLADN